MGAWWSKVRLALRGRRGLTGDLEEEYEAHLAMEAEERMSRGVAAERAREEARRAMGNRTAVAEKAREAWLFGGLEDFGRDLGYAARNLRKNPAFAVTAVLTLALGIGANTAMFSVIRAVLLKPLPYARPEQLVRISIANPSQRYRDIGFSTARFREMKAQAASFSELGAFFIATENMALAGNATPEQLTGARVTANFLHVLGVRPLVGRSFGAADDKRGGPQAAMISEELWRRNFGGRADVVGRRVTLNAAPCTVVGVLPTGFSFPAAGVDVWVTRPSDIAAIAPQFWDRIAVLIGLGRLKAGVTRGQAEAELAVLNKRYMAEHADLTDGRKGVEMQVQGLREQLVGKARGMLWVLFGAVGFVLLIACANVASLLLARAGARGQEMAVRAALGAGRARIVRQLLAESLLLSLVGGGLGVAVGWAGLRGLLHWQSLELPRAGAIRLDGWVLGFSVLLSLASGLIFGLVPALQVSRPNLADVLRERGQAGGGGSGRLPLRMRSWLVMAQVALSVILLIGAALLLQSVAHLRAVDAGLRVTNLLTMHVDLPPARYNTPGKKEVFFRELMGKLRAAPGVLGAAAVLTMPTGPKFETGVQIAEQERVAVEQRPGVQLQSVTPGYFETAGIAMKRGRAFTARDDENGVLSIVVNESFARRFWPGYPRGVDPVGQHILVGNNTQGALQVVGVAADVHEGGLGKDVEPEIYLTPQIYPLSQASLMVRTKGDPERMVEQIRRAVYSLDREQPVSGVKTMRQVLEGSVGSQRLTLLLLGTFAGMAVLLALIGLYGVITYTVVQRSDELGIRRALGAQTGDILRLVVGQALLLTVGGVVLGCLGALGLTRLMEGLLFHVRATDPGTFVGIGVLFVLAGLGASLLPGWRAARVDGRRVLG